MNESTIFILAFSVIFKYKIKNTKYKEQKTKPQGIKIITKIQNGKKMQNTTGNERVYVFFVFTELFAV